jgi:hypothetical protein
MNTILCALRTNVLGNHSVNLCSQFPAPLRSKVKQLNLLVSRVMIHSIDSEKNTWKPIIDSDHHLQREYQEAEPHISLFTRKARDLVVAELVTERCAEVSDEVHLYGCDREPWTRAQELQT